MMIAQPSEPTVAASDPIEAIQTKLQHLPPAQQQQMLDFVDFLASKTQLQPPQKTIWEKIRERMADVPEEEWDDVPPYVISKRWSG